MPMPPTPSTPDRPAATALRTTRRTALAGVAGIGVGVPLLAACGSDEPVEVTAPAAGTAVASTTDIEVGGGTIFAEQELVITQPTEGEFRGFSSICTHQSCPVTSVADGVIECTCHGSAFSITDGAPQGGPAETPLSEVALRVEGDQITVA